MDIFETATRQKYRFASASGRLLTEQLWDLPLLHRTRRGAEADLDGVARAISAELRELTEESFVEVDTDPRRRTLETKLAIVKHIIAVKQEEAKAAERRVEMAEKKRKLIEALAEAEAKEMSAMSKDEIRKQLAELDG